MKPWLSIALAAALPATWANAACAQNYCVHTLRSNGTYTTVLNGCNRGILMWYGGGYGSCRTGAGGRLYPCMQQLAAGQTAGINVEAGNSFYYVSCYWTDWNAGRCSGPSS